MVLVLNCVERVVRGLQELGAARIPPRLSPLLSPVSILHPSFALSLSFLSLSSLGIPCSGNEHWSLSSIYITLSTSPVAFARFFI